MAFFAACVRQAESGSKAEIAMVHSGKDS